MDVLPGILTAATPARCEHAINSLPNTVDTFCPCVQRAKNMQLKVTELTAKVASASGEKQFTALRNTYLLLKEDFKQMLTIVSSEVVPLTTFIIPSLDFRACSTQHNMFLLHLQVHPWGSGKNFKGETCHAGVAPLKLMKKMMQVTF